MGICLVIGTALESYQTWRIKNGHRVNNRAYAKFFLGFGIYNNTTKWLDTNVPKNGGHLACLDGIRFISMTWVVLGHSWMNIFGLLGGGNFNQPRDLITV